MARTKLTAAQIVTGLVSSSLNNVPTLTASGSGTVVFSGNNNSITLSPGTYLLTATASGKMVLTQDSTWGVDIYNGTTTVVTNSFGSLGASSTVWPIVACQTSVTITTQTTFTARIEQSFGSSATITNLCTTITFTKTA